MSPTGRNKVLDALIMVRMPGKLRRELEKLAAKDRRALSEYCRHVLEDHVKGTKK